MMASPETAEDRQAAYRASFSFESGVGRLRKILEK